MINDVLSFEIECVSNFGSGNYMFKANDRSYTLNIIHQTLFRFIIKNGGFSMTEEWFDATTVLNDKDFQELKQKLCI